MNETEDSQMSVIKKTVFGVLFAIFFLSSLLCLALGLLMDIYPYTLATHTDDYNVFHIFVMCRLSLLFLCISLVAALFGKFAFIKKLGIKILFLLISVLCLLRIFYILPYVNENMSLNYFFADYNYFFADYSAAELPNDEPEEFNWEEAEEKIKPEIAALELKKTGPAEIAEIVALELNWKAAKYKKLFNEPIPDCKQCSELEYLLILERTIDTITYLREDTKTMSFMKKTETAAKSELKKAEAKYEKKFKKPIPWWWVCSDEERLKRLEKSIEANKPYPYYSEDYSKETSGDLYDIYELGKAMAGYEMWFKKQPPECSCSNKEYLEYLRIALEIDVPYLTEEEDTELKIKLKAEHKKRFGWQISDFELSAASIYFRVGGFFQSVYSISMMKTAKGVIVRYQDLSSGEWLKTSLDIGEWLDFVNALNDDIYISMWDKYYNDKVLDGGQWGLEIAFLNKDELNTLNFSGSNAYPWNWDEFMKVMKGIAAKINKETGAKIRLHS